MIIRVKYELRSYFPDIVVLPASAGPTHPFPTGPFGRSGGDVRRFPPQLFPENRSAVICGILNLSKISGKGRPNIIVVRSLKKV